LQVRVLPLGSNPLGGETVNALVFPQGNFRPNHLLSLN
jgi:hypothetical protein